MELEVYTDGSSMFNGSPNCYAGWSACFVLNGKTYVRYGHLGPQSSNNKGELYGVLWTVLALREKKNYKVKIYSDSQYVCNSINVWRHGWKKKNYKDVKNLNLLLPLFDAWDEQGNCSIQWVRGHEGNAGNELADYWAGQGMRSADHTESNDKLDVKYIQEKKYV